MSHFTVAVLTENHGKSVEELLMPYHEFECTGIDEYIQNIDQLEEAKKEYEGYTFTRYQSPDGQLFDPYADQFYREPTEEEIREHGEFSGSGCGKGISWRSKDWNDGKGYRAKVMFKPDGYAEIEVSASKTMSLRDFIEYYYGRSVVLPGELPDLSDKHKYGWMRVNESGEVVELIDRTNPNAKWDWWQTGGRWSGLLLTKDGNRTDISVLKEIDWQKMADLAERKAEQTWDSNPEGINRYLADIHADDTKESYVKRMGEFQTYAVITPDGQWHSKGKMGWWGASSETEEEAKQWSISFYDRFIKDADQELTLTIVDCHI